MPQSRRHIEGHIAFPALAEEMATYGSRLPELLSQHAGQFVLIKGNAIAGFFPDESSAVNEGNRLYGGMPFLVKQVIAPESVI